MSDRVQNKEIDYKQFVGCYAKRFYSPFTKNRIVEIIDVIGIGLNSFLKVTDGHSVWDWDVEDSVIITNGGDTTIDLTRVIDVCNEQYNGYNPYN